MLSLTLRQIEYAVAVAGHGGMSAAAQALNVSQPALSVALSQLEATLGQTLFLRRPGGRLLPSPFGHRWLAEAQTGLARIGLLADPARLSEVSLRLGLFEDIAPLCLAPLLMRVKNDAPDLRLHAVAMGFETLAASLQAGTIDLGLTWDLGLQQDISRQVMVRIPPHAVLAPDHPLAAKATLSLADLAGQPLILTNQGLSISHMRGLFTHRGLVPVIAHSTATLDLMRSYAAHGLGVGLSYTNPAGRLSSDGKPFVTRPLRDAGSEALVLAQLAANPPSAAASLVASLLPQVLQGAAFPNRSDP